MGSSEPPPMRTWRPVPFHPFQKHLREAKVVQHSWCVCMPHRNYK